MANIYALIMAGGEGTRLYPLSTVDRPKQFLNFIGDKTFLRQSYDYVLPLTSPENVIISTNWRYVDLVKEQIPGIKDQDIIAEFFKKNTAPALAYAAALIARRDENAVMCCLPSDHYISEEEKFRELLKNAVELAREGNLVTLGITPTWACTGYGYILPENVGASWSKVSRFAEKPTEAVAEEYLKKGYLWNSGIFIWRARDFLNELEMYAPDVYEPLKNFDESVSFLYEYFKNAKSISVDYAVMEKSKRVAVIPASMGWNDVGTWDSVRLLIDQGLNVSPIVRSVMFGDESTPWRKITPKPWGHEELWAHTESYVGKILFIKKGHRLSYQYHKVKEETLRLLSGEIEMEFESGKKRIMKPGDVEHILPGMKHRMFAKADSLMLEASTTELDDVVRVEDDYGRVG